MFAGTQAGAQMPILKATIQTNQEMPEIICDRLLNRSIPGETIGILGLAFKPFTDDVRDTPAASIIACLKRRGVTSIMAYDPLGRSRIFLYYRNLK